MKNIVDSLFARIAIGFVLICAVTLSVCLPIMHNAQRAKTNAVDTDNALDLGNILSDDGASVNDSVLSALAEAVGGLYSNGETTETKKSALNNGQTIIFQMGTAFSKPVKWQVVYRTGNYVTAWMTDCYTNEYFNYNNHAPVNLSLAGYSTSSYETDANYSKSILRDVTNGIYTSLVASCPAIAELVVSPEEANIEWQKTQPAVIGYWDYYPDDSSSDYYDSAVTSGLQSNTNNGDIDYINADNEYGISDPLDTNPLNYNWDSTTYGDKFWIPSWYELFNTETLPNLETTPYIYNNDTGDETYNWNGLWGLEQVDIAHSTTNLDGTTNAYSWSRSSYSNNSYCAYDVVPSGSSYYYNLVNNSRAVRPALHLNLESAVPSTAPTVSATITGGSVSPASQKYTGSALTFGFNANTNYKITSIQIGVAGLGAETITPTATSEPSSFTTLSDANGMISGACKYKVWISGSNQVTVKVTEVSTNEILMSRGLSIIATTEESDIKVTTSSPSGASVDKTFATYSGSAITFTYTANSGYWINGLTIGGTTATISSTKPASYYTLSTLKYKAWRDGYKVLVEVTDVTANTSMSATTTSSLVTSNADSDHISSVSKSVSSYTNGTVTATYTSGYYPKIQLNNSGYITLINTSGSGQFGSASFSYTFSSNKLTLNLTGLAYAVDTVYLDAYATTTATTPLNVSIQGATNYTYKIDENGTTKTLVVYPASGYYVNSVQIDNGSAVQITYYVGQIVQDCNAHSISYTANNSSTDNMFTLTCNRMSGDVSVTVNISSTKPTLSMSTGATFVAVESMAGGEARVIGADASDTEYILVAVAYTGYEFVGWTIDDGVSYLKDSNGKNFLSSARVPASMVKGLVVKAKFRLIDTSKTNTETNNTSDIL